MLKKIGPNFIRWSVW